MKAASKAIQKTSKITAQKATKLQKIEYFLALQNINFEDVPVWLNKLFETQKFMEFLIVIFVDTKTTWQKKE